MRGKNMRVGENCVENMYRKTSVFIMVLRDVFFTPFSRTRVFFTVFFTEVFTVVFTDVFAEVFTEVFTAGFAWRGAPARLTVYRAAHGACARTMKYKKCARAPTFPSKCWLSSPFASLHASLCDPRELSRLFLRQPTRQHLLQRSQALSHQFVCQSMRQPLRQPSCCYSICPSPCAIPCASPCTRFCDRPLAVFVATVLAPVFVPDLAPAFAPANAPAVAGK